MRVALVALLAAGCNGLLGLDETAPDSSDGDRDGIPEAIDNCPGVANDQLDTDGDGEGDVCDPSPDGLLCPAGTRTGVDADSDGFDDGCQGCDPASGNEDDDADVDLCDVCPGITSNNTDDADLDGVGDACDPSVPTKNTRAAFDGFNGSGSPSGEHWVPSLSWVRRDGVLETGGKSDLMLRFTIPSVIAGDWSISTQFDLPPVATSLEETIGIVIAIEQGGIARCVLVTNDNGQTWRLVADGPTMRGEKQTPLAPGGTARLTARVLDNQRMDCALENAGVVPINDPALLGDVRLGLRSSIEAVFYHADIIRRR